MASVEIKDLPDVIMDQLRLRANHFHQNVEDVAKAIVVHAIASNQWHAGVSAEQLIERARKVREGHPHAWVTEEFLRMAKNDGRL